jgi:hypothetical protein
LVGKKHQNALEKSENYRLQLEDKANKKGKLKNIDYADYEYEYDDFTAPKPKNNTNSQAAITKPINTSKCESKKSKKKNGDMVYKGMFFLICWRI